MGPQSPEVNVIAHQVLPALATTNRRRISVKQADKWFIGDDSDLDFSLPARITECCDTAAPKLGQMQMLYGNDPALSATLR